MSLHSKALIVALALVCVANSTVALPKADEIVRKVQERYDATTDLTADVTQEATIASLDKTVSARGKVWFKKPGKMRWELTEGDKQTIVADGSTLWLYRPEDQQVLKMPFDAAFRSTSPVSFLTGVGRIAQDFNASLDGEKDDVVYLMLVPRRESSEVGRLRLGVSRDTYDIRSADIHDPMGNVSRLRFEQLQRNSSLSDERFVFVVPPGVDVISAPAS